MAIIQLICETSATTEHLYPFSDAYFSAYEPPVVYIVTSPLLENISLPIVVTFGGINTYSSDAHSPKA